MYFAVISRPYPLAYVMYIYDLLLIVARLPIPPQDGVCVYSSFQSDGVPRR